MIEYNQMIDACHMARSHNLSTLIEAEAKESSLYLSLPLLMCLEYLQRNWRKRSSQNTHCAPAKVCASDTAAVQKYALC